MQRLNGMVSNLFALTPFHVQENRDIPYFAKEDNDNASITFKYFNNEDRPVDGDGDGDGESYVYTIRPDGSDLCDTSGETLNLNDISHLSAIACTIIRDIYGDFDSTEVVKQWMLQRQVAADASEYTFQ